MAFPPHGQPKLDTNLSRLPVLSSSIQLIQPPDPNLFLKILLLPLCSVLLLLGSTISLFFFVEPPRRRRNRLQRKPQPRRVHLKMMNRCAYQQQNAMGGGGGCEETMMRMESVVCPKPRRFHSLMMGDSVAGGSELLDIILSKGGYGGERSPTPVASSPPYFCGSPPIRAPNPVIRDAEFGRGMISQFSTGPPSPRKSGGPGRVSFGQNPAMVRIEGFDCMGRDRGNCSISALA